MSKLRNIVVTGSNKGIGYGIVEKLASKNQWNIIMACRNKDRGSQAKQKLISKFSQAKINVQQLDITDKSSIYKFEQAVKDKYKNIDVLINNAGVSAKPQDFSEQTAKKMLDTNFYGTIKLTDHLIPHISNSGKIIFVGGLVGKTKKLSEELRKKFKNPQLSREQIFAMMKDFQQGVKNGDWSKRGWQKYCYGVSKMGINHFAQVLSNEQQIKDKNIQVYSLCPGYTATDLTENKGPQKIQQAAVTPVYLAQLPFEVDPKIQGKYFEKCKVAALD